MGESTYAPMYSSHGHERKTHIATSDGLSLCGIERRYPDLLWNHGATYYDIENQFFIDADGFGCKNCRRCYRKLKGKSND